jgi:hypothetical protein
MDGTPTLRMNEFVLASIAHGKANLGPTRVNASRLPAVEELIFELDDKVQKSIKDAEARFEELVGKHDLEVRTYTIFIKKTSYIFDCFFFFFFNLGITLRRIRKELYKSTQNISRRYRSTHQTARIS